MRRTITLAVIIITGLSFVPAVFASDEDDMAEMQRQLNKEVLEKPFSVADQAKIDAYVQDAMKKNLQPIENPPANWNWQPGYTCANIYNYGWHAYSQCAHYHHYYGHYW